MTIALRNEEYRALQIFDRIPAEHIGVVVISADFEPHLQRSEIAIVDTADKSTQFGELYVLTMNLGSEKRLQHLAIVQLIRAHPEHGGLTYGFSFVGKGGLIFKGQRLRYVDGPLLPQYWPEKCVGRIVGVMPPQWAA